MLVKSIVTQFRRNSIKFVNVRFYPEIVLSAMRSKKQVGGVRLFILAKHFDNGNGHIPIDDFKHYCQTNLEIPKARFNRWLREAVQLGVMARVGDVFAISSWGNAAVAVGGIERLGRPVEMPIVKLAGEGWAAWAWAAYLKRHENKPIARVTLEKLTGVPERTQRHYEAEAGVKNIANYATENEPIAKQGNGYFWYYGQPKKRLGNSRVISGVEACKRGRTANHNRTLATALSLWDSSQSKQRLYFENVDALKTTLRKMRKANQPYYERPDVVYLHSCNVMGVSLWGAVSCD